MKNIFLLGIQAVADSTAISNSGSKEETLPILDLILDSWVIMIPLLALSIVAVYIWVERYNAIQKASKMDPGFMSNIKGFVSEGKIDEARQLCANTDTPVARMMEKGISRLGRPLKDISTSIETVAKLEISMMEKGLSILATISGAAPMIGFLGTVIGMILSIFEIANSGGQIDIKLLADGLYTAMTTTVAGLIVGIVAYMAYNHLVVRTDKVVYQMEANSLEFLDHLNEPG